MSAPTSRGDGRLQCEICGRWYIMLGSHVVRSHEMTVREYQIEHDLPLSRGVASQAYIERRSETQREIMASLSDDERAARTLDPHVGARARDPEAISRGTRFRDAAYRERIAETLRSKVPPIVCAVCGVEFRPAERRTRTCSPECFRGLQRQHARDAGLTERQTQVVAMAEQGVSSAEIGRQLGITRQAAYAALKGARRRLAP